MTVLTAEGPQVSVRHGDWMVEWGEGCDKGKVSVQLPKLLQPTGVARVRARCLSGAAMKARRQHLPTYARPAGGHTQERLSSKAARSVGGLIWR